MSKVACVQLMSLRFRLVLFFEESEKRVLNKRNTKESFICNLLHSDTVNALGNSFLSPHNRHRISSSL